MAIQPIFSSVGDDYPLADAHREIAEWCRANRILVLDLQPVFSGLDSKGLVVHPRDHHPNATAHRVMAAAIEEFLRNEVLDR